MTSSKKASQDKLTAKGLIMTADEFIRIRCQYGLATKMLNDRFDLLKNDSYPKRHQRTLYKDDEDDNLAQPRPKQKKSNIRQGCKLQLITAKAKAKKMR